MKKIIKKKLRIIILTMIVVLSLVGCGESLNSYVENELSTALESRVDANIDIVEKLYKSGLIGDNTYNSLLKTLKKQKDLLTKEVKKLKSNDGDSVLVKAIVRYSTINGASIGKFNDGNTIINDNKGHESDTAEAGVNDNGMKCLADPHPCTASEDVNLKYYAVINYLMLEKGKFGSTKKITPDHVKGHEVKSNITPIKLLDDRSTSKLTSELNEKFDYDVYVLKPDILTKDATGSLDGVMELLKSNVKIKEGNTITNIGNLNNYFAPAVDANGKNVKLIETGKDKNGNALIPEDFQLVKNSRKQYLNGKKNTPGYDLIIKQWNVPTFTLRFLEFDSVAFDNLNKLMGMNEGKYLFYNQDNVKRVYLMEYPVSVLKTLKEDPNNANLVTGELEKSGLGINLFTGKILKYDPDGKGGWKETATPVAELTDSYLTTDSASSNDKTGLSSFIVKGTTTTVVSHSFVNKNGGNSKTVVCGRVILRDYLEGSYAPDYVQGENIAVFGRKIRLSFDKWKDTKFKVNGTEVPGVTQYTPQWTKEMDAAKFVDKKGEQLVDTPTLKITDFCDINELGKSDYKSAKVKYIREKGQRPSVQEHQAQDGIIPKVTELEHESIDSKGGKIKVSTYFPSATIGKNDYNSDSESKQRFYVLAVKNDMFETKLFSDWINSNSTKLSLQWWNKYLTKNKFTYSLDFNAVKEYVTSQYKYEVMENGIVILDLNTISDIQKMFDRDEDIHTMQRIRTWFMIIGWLIIVYSMILMLCWGIDTNADIGIKLLEKATFGHWIAVKYEHDIPYNKQSDITYLTGGKMVIKCVVLIVTGLILIYTNIFIIITELINLLGPFAQEFEKIITGMR